jgi:LacI family transcriptional regulator
VTIKTIAAAAGVHPSTVSRALRADGEGRVGDKTVKRIRELADSLGYEPNPWARSLRTRQSHTLGLVLPRLTEFLARMFEGVEDRAREAGYQAVTASTRDEEAEERRLVRGLIERRVDGLIIATSSAENALLDELRARHVPFQLMNRTSGSHPCVSADDELGGYLATKHLLAHGHSRVAFIAGPRRFSTPTMRMRGYVRAHSDEGVPVDEKLIVESGFDAFAGLASASVLLSRSNRPTAIFTVNDAVAIGVLAAARDLGLRVPRDLAVVGYNDNELSQMLPVPLSTVAIPLEEMGRMAVDLLLDQMRTGRRQSVTLQPRLIVRASSGTTARGDDA